ncbi:unnamed protein product [Mesocestoides corti]|nr:unnamed protein product [Mesocestoides corti]
MAVDGDDAGPPTELVREGERAPVATSTRNRLIDEMRCLLYRHEGALAFQVCVPLSGIHNAPNCTQRWSACARAHLHRSM